MFQIAPRFNREDDWGRIDRSTSEPDEALVRCASDHNGVPVRISSSRAGMLFNIQGFVSRLLACSVATAFPLMATIT